MKTSAIKHFVNFFMQPDVNADVSRTNVSLHFVLNFHFALFLSTSHAALHSSRLF